MAVMKTLDQIGADIRSEADKYHVPAQIGRFAFLFGSALAVQAASGAPLLGWSDLRALVVGAVGVAWRQWTKTMPVGAAVTAVQAAAQPRADEPSAH